MTFKIHNLNGFGAYYKCLYNPVFEYYINNEKIAVKNLNYRKVYLRKNKNKLDLNEGKKVIQKARLDYKVKRIIKNNS